MRFDVALLTYTFLLWGSVANAQTALSFRPVETEYSAALSRLAMISEAPNRLHIYDPASGADVVVNLPKAPRAVSVSPNGLYAAVGYDSLVQYVNLTNGVIEKSWIVTGVVSEVVTASAYVYLFSGTDPLSSIEIATGAISSNGKYRLAGGRLHPSGRRIYMTRDGVTPNGVEFLDVSTGPVTGSGDSPYHGEYEFCGTVWVSPDGARIYNGCGSVQTASTDPKLELTYKGRLRGFYGEGLIGSLSESAGSGRIAAMAGTPPSFIIVNPTAPKDNEILLYDASSLELNGRLRLPDFSVSGKAFAAHGRFLTFDNTGTKLFVVMQADGTAGLLNDFAVYGVDLANPAPCAPVAAPASVTAPWNGTVGTLSLTAAPNCLYSTATTAPWVQVTDYRLASGNTRVGYHVRANPTGATRTADITIGGQTVTVTQAGALAPRPVSVLLSYPVVDAEYSAALDRTVLVSAGPNELHLLDAVTGGEMVVALFKPPLSVSVRPDGLYAAVGHDGWLSVVNLQTATVERVLPVVTDVSDVILAGNGMAYLFPRREWSDMYTVEVATGAWTGVSAIYTGRTARLHPSGLYFYSGDGSPTKWSIASGTLVREQSNTNVTLCGNYWYSQDGGRIFTGCGTVLRSSATPSQDLVANGSFPISGIVAWADHSAARGMTAVLATQPNEAQPSVTLYGDEFLGPSSTRTLPVLWGASNYQTQGRFVFWSGAGERIYVYSKVDAAAGVANDTVVTLIAPNIGTGGCTVVLNGTGLAAAKAGDFGTLGVTSGNGCNWTAASSASWLRITAGTFGLGSGSVLWAADGNTGAAARSATITVGGQTFTVTQAGTAPVAVPAVVGASPVNPTTAVQPVTFTVRDGDGTGNLARVYFHIGASSTVSANGCHGFYDRVANAMFLYNDGLTVPQGPVTPGVAGTIENGQCRLSGAASGVITPSATDMAVTFGLELKGSYLTGARNVYLWVTDAQQNGTGWTQTGTWTVAAAVNVAPTFVAGSSGLIGLVQNVMLTARDGNGGSDIARIYFVVNPTADVPVNSCHGFYDRALHAIYLYNDALSILQGPLTPGTGGTLQNSQCAIDGASSTVTTPNANDVAVTLGMRMQGAYATGSRNVYVWAVDREAAGTGWVQLAVWTATVANQAPTVVSGLPASSTAVTQPFTFVARDGDGFANLSRVYFLVNQTIGVPANTCHGFYERANNAFYLYSDRLTTLSGPMVAGTAGVLQNSQCSLNVGSSSVSGSGTDLTLTMAMTARGSYVGVAQRVAMWAVDAQGNGTGWVQTGTWSAGVGAGPVAPTVVSWTPVGGSGIQNTLFTVLARDANGYGDIDRVYFVVSALNGPPTVAVGGCHGFYDRAANAVYLYNAALTGLLGPLAPNSAGSLSNGVCQVNGTGLTVAGDGNDLTLALPMQMKNAIMIAGMWRVSFWAVDRGNLGTGWAGGPSWTGMGLNEPVVTPVAPVAVAGATQTFSVTVSAASLDKIYFLVNPTPNVPLNGCHGYYERASGFVGLYNDALTATSLNAVSPGSVVPLANSQCSVNLAASSVSTNGTNTTLNLVLTRTGAFASGTQTMYWWAVDNNRLGTGWWPTAVWTP